MIHRPLPVLPLGGATPGPDVELFDIVSDDGVDVVRTNDTSEDDTHGQPVIDDDFSCSVKVHNTFLRFPGHALLPRRRVVSALVRNVDFPSGGAPQAQPSGVLPGLSRQGASRLCTHIAFRAAARADARHARIVAHGIVRKASLLVEGREERERCQLADIFQA